MLFVSVEVHAPTVYPCCALVLMWWLTHIACLWLLRTRFLVVRAGSERPSPPLLTNVDEGADAAQLVFRLRHMYGMNNATHALVLKNVSHGTSLRGALALCTKRVGVHRPKSSLNSGEWDEDEIESPDVTNKDTLLALAKMTSNAYYDSPDTGKSGWYNLGNKWNIVRCLCLLRHSTHSLGEQG